MMNLNHKKQLADFQKNNLKNGMLMIVEGSGKWKRTKVYMPLYLLVLSFEKLMAMQKNLTKSEMMVVLNYFN